MRQAREKRGLAPTGMVESLHGEEFAVDGVVRLIQHGAHRRHVWGCEQRIPAGFLVLEPMTNALAMHLLPPSWRCDRQSGAGTGPMPLPADFYAVGTGVAGSGTVTAAPGAPRP